MESGVNEKKRAWEKATRELFAEFPQQYDKLCEHVVEAEKTFKGFIADYVAQPLNSKIKEMPRETYDERLEVARWCNEEVKKIGLIIQCPVTQQPGVLHVINRTGEAWPGGI